MRSPLRIPTHLAPSRPFPERSEGDDDPSFRHRPCYVFNPRLPRGQDDARCRHCRHYLTANCPHIDEFLDDVEDLSPE